MTRNSGLWPSRIGSRCDRVRNHEKVPLPTSMSECAPTTSTTRDCTREPSGFRIDVDYCTANSRSVEFVKLEES